MSNGTLACRELVEAHLARIDEVNPALNALVAAPTRKVAWQRPT
jgi:amidase